MGREKSEIHNRDRKSLQKTSLGFQDKSRPSKKLINKKEPEDIDSLIFLKDTKDEKMVNGLDDRIKLLKSELKMLLGNTKSENTDYSQCLTGCEGDFVSPDLVLDKHNQETHLNLPSDIKSVEKFDYGAKHSLNLQTSPSKLSEWLDKNTDEIAVNSQTQVEFPKCDNLTSPKSRETTDEFFTSKPCHKSRLFNSSPLSQHKVEQLLYQSLYLQYFDVYLSSSDENGTDEVKSAKKTKQQKQKSRKSRKKSSKEKLNQSSANKHSRSSCRPRKRRRMTANSFSKSNVEVVDLVHYSPSHDNVGAAGSSNVDCVDLDITDYDWDEPFDVNEEAEFFSDVEILENSREENVGAEKVKLSNCESVEKNLDALNNKRGSVQLSAGWECPICFELSKGQAVVATQCGHLFCKKCLESHISKFSNNCPTCRTDLNDKPSITLFNF